MASESYMAFNGSELFNVARTSRLASSMGLNTVRIKRELVNFIQARFIGYGFGLGGFGEQPFGGPADVYADITQAPWYDAGVPASREFAGVVPLAMQGLDDSSYQADVTEYTGDGANTGKGRNGSQSLVASVAIVAKTDRGAEYGKRWLDRVLRGKANPNSCSGSDLTYYRYDAPDAPRVHRRDVALTRGTSVTRKKFSACSATWLATFTLTAGDPYEYGVGVSALLALGYDGVTTSGLSIQGSGSFTDNYQGCPVYTYTPIYDPLYPALVPSPTAPNFLPAGWSIDEGDQYNRVFARLGTVEPSGFRFVPMIRLKSTVEARMVRISVFPSSYSDDAQCDALFSTVIGYLPPNSDFYIDGEQRAAYIWDGSSDYVRRTDSLVFSPEGNPVEWRSFEPGAGLLVTMDAFSVAGGGYQGGGGQMQISLTLIPKSD